MQFEVYKGGSQSWTDPDAWKNGIAPISDSYAFIEFGTVTATDLTLNGDVVNITADQTSFPVVNFNNTTLGVDSQVTLTATNLTIATLSLTGQDVNNGLISGGSGLVGINVGTSSEAGSFTNNGTLEGNLAISGPGNLINKGLVVGRSGGGVRFTCAVTNYGTMLAEGYPDSFGSVAGFAAFDNEGLIDVQADGGFGVGYWPNAGTFTNGGSLEIRGSAAIHGITTQTGHGVTNVDGGNLYLDGAFQGGTIYVSAGTVEFGAPYQLPLGAGPHEKPISISPPAAGFAAGVDFTGPTGTLAFDGYTNLSASLQGNQLLVEGAAIGPNGPAPVQQIADIQIVGTYSGDEFQVSGTLVSYTSKPPAGGDKTQTPPPVGGGTTGDTTPPPADGGTTGNTTPPADGCRVFDTTTGQSSNAAVSPYSGPVAGLTSQFIDVTGNNLAVTATVPNVFIHTGSGEDAIDVSGVNGNNVLDGGTGSNFLVGGTGHDKFFVDDRSPAANIWSTVVNLHSGDDLTIWGVSRSDFSLSWLDGQGAVGATGLTGIVTKSGQPEALMTLKGYTSADLTDGKLTLTYGQTADQPGLPGSSYLLIHAN